MKTFIGSALLWAGAAQALSGKQLRILPLGDSITLGALSQPNGGYRGPLLSLLDGNQVNYVGSISDGTIRDVNHEGWAGFGTVSIKYRYLFGGGRALPNVILLDTGTNDIFSNRSTTSVADTSSAINNLLDSFFFVDKTAVVIIAQIGPFGQSDGDTQRNARTQQLNANIRSMVADKQGKGYLLDTIDIFNNLTQADIGDGVHPNAQGYNKIARLWLDKLNSINTNHPTWISTPQTTTTNLTTGFFVCPTNDNIPIQFNGPFGPTSLANQQNQFGGITCNQDSSNANQCQCTDPSGPNPNTASTQAKPAGRSCGDMNTNRVQAVQFGDINGDNRADYLYVGARGTVDSWLVTGQKQLYCSKNNGEAADATFQSQGNIFGGTPSSSRSSIRTADVTGNGLADILVVGMGGDVQLWTNNGVFSTSNTQPGPGFNPQGIIFSGTVNGQGFPGSGLQFADLDADGKADLIYIGSNGDITAFKNNGPSGNIPVTFGPPQSIFNGPGFPFGRDSIIVQDTSGDGRADLIVQSRSDSTFKIFENLGQPNDNSFRGFNSTARYTQSSSLSNTNGANYVWGDIGGLSRAALADVDPNTSAIRTWTNLCATDYIGLAIRQQGDGKKRRRMLSKEDMMMARNEDMMARDDPSRIMARWDPTRLLGRQATSCP